MSRLPRGRSEVEDSVKQLERLSMLFAKLKKPRTWIRLPWADEAEDSVGAEKVRKFIYVL